MNRINIKKHRITKLLITLFILGLISLPFLAPKLKRLLTQPPVYRPQSQFEFTKINLPSLTDPLPTVKPLPRKALLPGAKWVAQTFNNCGPATVSMILQYFGHTVDQNQTKAALRTNSDDKNVFTYEISDYLKTGYGIESRVFVNGDVNLIKTLVANGFYVMLDDWLHPNEDIGHVTIIRGYDDDQGVFIADDSYIGVNITYKYDVFDQEQWKPFNRQYLPIYKPEQEKLLMAIVGDNWDTQTMYQTAVAQAQSEIRQNDRDMYAHFNLGTSLYALGKHQEAQAAFSKSRSLGWPKRMLWYQIQPVQTLNKLNRFQEALDLANVGLWSNDSFAELHVEKAISYIGLGQKDRARTELQTALNYSPNLKSAQDLLNSI